MSDSFCGKKLVCKHTLTSGKLPSSITSLHSPLPDWELVLRQFPAAGVQGVGSRHGGRRGTCACQAPAGPQVLSSCGGGGDSTYQTPPALRGGGKVPKRLVWVPKGATFRTRPAFPHSTVRAKPGRPHVAGWELSHPRTGVRVRAGGGASGRRSPQRRNPASFQPVTGARSRAPRPNLALAPGRPARPWPSRAPLTVGPAGRRPHGAAAAARAPGSRGIPERSPARPGLRARDGLRALPARPWPARVRSQPLGVRSSSRAGGGGGSGSSLRPRRGGCAEGGAEARRALPGGESTPAGGAGARSRPLPAAASPGLARSGPPRSPAVGARMFQPESQGPSGRGRNPRAGTPRIATPLVRTLRRPPSAEPPAPPSSQHRALAADAAETEGWVRPGPWVGGRPRAPPVASSPRADGLSAAPSGDTPQGLVLGGTEPP